MLLKMLNTSKLRADVVLPIVIASVIWEWPYAVTNTGWTPNDSELNIMIDDPCPQYTVEYINTVVHQGGQEFEFPDVFPGIEVSFKMNVNPQGDEWLQIPEDNSWRFTGLDGKHLVEVFIPESQTSYFCMEYTGS